MSSNIYVQRICHDCAKEFTARTTVTKFCSDMCASRNYKKRKRGEKIYSSDSETSAVRSKPLVDVQSKQFLCIVDACLLLGVSRQTVWRAIKSGRLNSVRLGRRVLFKRDDIDRLFGPAPAITQGILLNDKGKAIHKKPK